ncbi:MAG: hypothetical protein JWN72_2743 [Thermoleophilia bacterium]|nr:hypothetical protein [Thermoleophilia bacterium]
MTSTISGGLPSNDATALAARLDSLATMAQVASNQVHVDYLSDPTKVARDLQFGGSRANQVASRLQGMLPEIHASGAGDDGVMLAQRAIDQLTGGVDALREGIAFPDDVLRSTPVALLDEHAPKVAQTLFGDAAKGLHGLADLAGVVGMTDDAFQSAVQVLGKLH